MEKAIRRYWPVFVLPTLIAFIIGFVWPFIWGAGLSFCKFTTVNNVQFVGLSNYAMIWSDNTFTHAFWFTAAFTVVSTLLINVLAFAIALLLTRGMHGTNAFRTIFFLPNLIGGIVLGYIWQILLNGLLSSWGKSLLAPAGSLETLKYAVMYGADAVYCALPEFGMRAAPVNLTVGELHEGCIFAHARGKKVYLTLNTLPTNEELSKLPRYIQDAAEAGVDAFIIADLGVLALAKKYAPQVERHVSTQAGITNYEAANVCYELGAKRVVLARELPLTEIAQIRDNCPQDLELEAFVHGAMCMSVSGRCLLSSYMAGRSGNRGECAQPCRWKYSLVEEHRPGQYMEIGESEDNGSYILNANDLCTAPFIDLIAMS